MHTPRTLFSILLIFASSAPALAEPPTGRLHLTFSDHGPSGKLEEICRRADFMNFKSLSPAEISAFQYNLSNESFEIFVPPAYKPDNTYGLIIFISPDQGVIPPAWIDTLSRRKLLFASANNSGNQRLVPIRMGLALDAADNLKKRYALNEKRIYIAGFSGGAGVASFLIRGYPDLFHGALLMAGGNFYETHRTKAGLYEPTVEAAPWEGSLPDIKKDISLVLLRGELDPNLPPKVDHAQYEALLLDGFQRATFLVVPNLPHNIPDAHGFDNGLAALDQSKPAIPPDISPTKDPQPLPSQIAQAQRLLASAQLSLDKERRVSQRSKNRPAAEQERIRTLYRNDARKYLQQLLADYPTAPAAKDAEKLLPTLDLAPTQPTTAPADHFQPDAAN